MVPNKSDSKEVILVAPKGRGGGLATDGNDKYPWRVIGRYVMGSLLVRNGESLLDGGLLA